MANEQMREQWTIGARGWVEQQRLFDHELAPWANALVEALAPGPGDRVLDVGCGTGELVERATERGADAVGIDIAPAMVEAAALRVPSATFLCGDAQTDDLTVHGPFTSVVSRFGVMFFEDPIAAFANVRRATAPGARLAFACWRGVEENPIFTLGTSVLWDRLDPAPPPARPGAPGAVAFAEPGSAEAILTAAGWTEARATPLDLVLDYGLDGSDGVEERLAMVLNTNGGQAARAQLEPRLGPTGWADLLEEVRADLRRHLVDGRMAFPGATWLVTARNPG